MLLELLSIFRTNNPLRAIGDSFAKMFTITNEMTISAGNMLFEGHANPELRTLLYQKDREVNKLQRTIRKKVVAHMSVAGHRADVPYCLLLMSLVKDVERLGDYAKNLSEVIDLRHSVLPDDEITSELGEIRSGVESAYQLALDVFTTSNSERAIELIAQGRDLAHRCDALLGKISRSKYDAASTTAAVLATRYYKRIDSHVLNILSAVVMPLHKVDYFDEKEITTETKPK
tara:strand:- start:1370 stop:2062 length:693 start_codon:yes stop_codon:yes gene_type:complete